MGKWDHRLPRRIFRRRRSPEPPPKFYDINALLPEYWQDGIPLWEKKYCTIVGLVPWQKIVDSKMFKYCHTNVFDWNDSAAEEAFQNAKKLYWAKINRLSCDISMLDPDIYIDQIDWNPYIDPHLIKEIDNAFFNVSDEEQENAMKNKRTKTSVDDENPWECTDTLLGRTLENNKVQGWNQGNSGNVDNTDNPWECSENHGNGGLTDNAWTGEPSKSWGWNEEKEHNDQCKDWNSGNLQDKGWGKVSDSSWCQQQFNNSGTVDDTDNPWECSFSHGNGGLTDNAWEGGPVMSWGWNKGKDHNNHHKDWIPGNLQDKGWGKVRDSSWCQQQSNNVANIGNSSWQCKSSQQNVTPMKTAWRNSGENLSRWKRPEKADVSSDFQFRRNYGGWTARNQGNQWNQRNQWREGSYQHTSGYNGSQFQRDGRQSGRYLWKEKSKKRDFVP